MSIVVNLMIDSIVGPRRSSVINTRIHTDDKKNDDIEAEISSSKDLYDDADNFVFDSVYVHFDFSVFIHQFILHMLLPFSIWMSPSPKSQLMWWDKDISYGDMIGSTLVMICNTTAFVSIISYEFMPEVDRIHYFGAVAYPILFSTMWRLSVATKYAMFSPTEYKRIMTFKSWAVNDAYYDQTLINSNVIDVQNDHVNRFEIAAGAHRADVKNVDTIKFLIENPHSSKLANTRMEEWSHFLVCTTPELNTTVGYSTTDMNEKDKKDHMLSAEGYHFNLQKQEDGSYALSLFDLCRHIQIFAHQESGKELNSELNWVSTCAIIVVALIPFFTLINGTYHVQDNVTIVFLAITTFDCLFFLRTIFTRFMMGAIIDYRRQYIMQRAFNDLLRTSEFDNKIRYTLEGHWRTTDRKDYQTKDDEVNNAVIQAFHGVRESEKAAKRRLTIELRSTMDHGMVRDVLAPVQKPEREGEGEGKSENGVEQVEAFTEQDSTKQSPHTDQHHISHALPEIRIPLDHDAVGGHTVPPISTHLKHNYYEHTLMSARGPPPNTSSVKGFPRISLDYDGNIFSWVQARQVMTTFKIRFRRRIEVVAGIFFLSTMGSVIACFATLYSSADIVAAYSSPFVIQTIVVVTVFALALIKYVAEAARINSMFDRHKLSIRNHQLKLHAMIAYCKSIPCSKELRESLAQRNDALEACATFIETANSNDPCEVFGIKAEFGLTFSICSGLVSFFITLVSIYYYNGGDKTILKASGNG